MIFNTLMTLVKAQLILASVMVLVYFMLKLADFATKHEAPFRASDVAREVKKRYKAIGCKISKAQLHRILYYIQTKSLTEKGVPIIRENFIATKNGPALPSVFDEMSSLLDNLLIDRNPLDVIATVNKKAGKEIEDIVGKTIMMEPAELIMCTKNTKPWENAFNSLNGQVISNDMIKECGIINIPAQTCPVEAH